VATLSLLGFGAVFALLKGVDAEEAVILGFVALALFPCRDAFTRKSRLVSEALSPAWIMAVLGAVVAAGWLGFFAYRHVDYSDDLWWTFLRDADASRFMRGAAGASVVVALVSAWSLLAPPRTRFRGRPVVADVDRAAACISTAEDMRGDAHLALLGDKDLLFSPTGKSFIMFRARNHRWIAMSEPCGLVSERRALMWRFAELADEAGASPVFYSITDALLPDVAEQGMAVRKIGETAIVPVQSFSLEGKERAGLRQSRNKAERDGAIFEILPPGSASLLADELKAVSDSWLTRHKGSEKAFSLGRFDIAYLDRTPLAVARSHGRISAFANVWATPDKRELTVDLMRYGGDAPRSVMDYLFVRLIEWGKTQGYREFDLGMAPLAGLDTHRLAPAFSRIGAAVFEDGEALYGFRGLRAYKEKFAPEWRPLYIAARPSAIMGLVLLDAALLTSGGWKGIFGGVSAAKGHST
jgi:phosphatidylglycerol lysyltransferase